MDKKQKRILVGVSIGALILLILFTLFFSEKGIFTYIKVKKEWTAGKKSLDSLLSVNDSLKKEISLLESDSFKIEKIAREKYGMIKEGEKVYKVEKKKVEN